MDWRVTRSVQLLYFLGEGEGKGEKDSGSAVKINRALDMFYPSFTSMVPRSKRVNISERDETGEEKARKGKQEGERASEKNGRGREREEG